MKRLKESRHERETEEEKLEKKTRREKEAELKHQKLDEIREQIRKIGSNDKDILYLKINEKIEHLEEVVKVALEEIQEEKEAKFVKNKAVTYNSKE